MHTLDHRPLVADLIVNALESTIFLNWTVPIIHGVDPIISDYCVNVVDETSNLALSSTCGINETKYIHPIPPRSWCSVYVFTVTVANSSGNAGERDSKVYQGADTPPEVTEALAATANIYSLTMVRTITYVICA